MRWTGLATGLVVVLATAACLAETPEWSSGNAASAPLLSRGRMFAGQNWWTRYGEPVNATALAENEPAKGQPQSGPVPLYGDGYIYSPGACDCPPPCIWHLWTGYEQHPKRCDPYVPLLHRHCNCDGDGCCGSCGLFGCGKGCGCGPSCGTQAACGCGAAVGCTTAAADCGCSKPVCGSCKHCHLAHKWKHFAAHWHRTCDSCAAPLGCGSAAPVIDVPPSEKQVFAKPPLPLPDDAALLSLPRIN
jgi:hypothetical protein